MTNAEMKVDAIEHWKRMRKNPVGCWRRNESPSWTCCAFCRTYYYELGCIPCPIRKATKRVCCSATPYPNAIYAWASLFPTDGSHQNPVTDPVEFLNALVEWRVEAWKEIAFLESLEV